MDKTEMNAAPEDLEEIAEAQLSITIEDLESEKAAFSKPALSAIDELKARNAAKHEENANIAEKAESDSQSAEKAEVRDNSENGEKTESSESAEAPEERQKHLSDMEVIEHTANIWQYKEIIDDKTEMHTEFHEKRRETEFGEILGARVRGKKHKHEGTNCDDYFETALSEECFIAAVCDGAGSKPLSRIGSRVSAERAVSFLKGQISELFKAKPEIRNGLSADLKSAEFMAACGRIAPLVQQSAREAFKAQREELEKLENDEIYINSLGRKPVLSDLSTTFLAVVAVPLVIDGKREVFLACVQIGDGCICALNSKAEAPSCVKLMGEADSGAFSGETDFLSEKNTDPKAISAKTRVSRGSSDLIMIMSDGVADDYFPAVPMMERLYLDLGLNGVIPMQGEAAAGEDPAPIRFHSVSMSRTSIALQYSKQLLADNSAEAMNGLWEKRAMLRCHSLEAFRMNIGDTPEERLRVWLDNYNERGSFDDRTLVIIRLTDGN